MSDKMKDVLKSVWQFCMFMFWPMGGLWLLAQVNCSLIV